MVVKEAVHVTVTDAAANKVLELSNAAFEHRTLRIDIRSGGCCGTCYNYSLTHPKKEDLRLEVKGVVVALSVKAAPILHNAKLDYGARLKPPRFRILKNPNTPERCACNRSFGKPFPGKTTPYCQAYEPMPWDRQMEEAADAS